MVLPLGTQHRFPIPEVDFTDTRDGNPNSRCYHGMNRNIFSTLEASYFIASVKNVYLLNLSYSHAGLLRVLMELKYL